MTATRRTILIAGGAIGAAGLGLLALPRKPPPTTGQLRIFAASSLTDALDNLADIHEAGGRPRPKISYAASSVLARQIEQGAEADLFLAADEPWMDHLAALGLIEAGTRERLLSNRLALIAPHDRTFSLAIAPGFDLAGALAGGKLAMADPDSVPAGRYGRAALENLGVWQDIAGAVARAENVRAALRYVETGEAAAGIVYRTDALAAGAKVRIVGLFPAYAHPPISYPMAVVKGANRSLADDFRRFLRSPAARTEFERLGFLIVPAADAP